MTTLTAMDRCDTGDGAAALVRLATDHTDQFGELLGSEELQFCGHHATKFMPKLDAQGFRVIIDHRPSLVLR